MMAHQVHQESQISQLPPLAVAGLMTALEKADAEVSRLKEWTDVFKRVADDKAQQAAQELQAFKARAAERQVAAAGGYLTVALGLPANSTFVGSQAIARLGPCLCRS